MNAVLCWRLPFYNFSSDRPPLLFRQLILVAIRGPLSVHPYCLVPNSEMVRLRKHIYNL